MLYLYLASNANGYELALSPAAIKDAIGMPRSTFHDQFHKLQKKGYLVLSHGNTFDFYEVPQNDSRNENNEFSDGQVFENDTCPDMDMLAYARDVLGEDIEINNIKYPQIRGINNGQTKGKKKYPEGFEF